MPRQSRYRAPSEGDAETLRIMDRCARTPRRRARARRPAKLKYQVGDQCYITINAALLVRGCVVAHFEHPSYPNTFYVIQVAAEDHPFLEVRDALTMKPNKNDPFPFWQNTEKDLPRPGN